MSQTGGLGLKKVCAVHTQCEVSPLASTSHGMFRINVLYGPRGARLSPPGSLTHHSRYAPLYHGRGRRVSNITPVDALLSHNCAAPHARKFALPTSSGLILFCGCAAATHQIQTWRMFVRERRQQAVHIAQCIIDFDIDDLPKRSRFPPCQ